jgi:hypothetical protein
MRISVLGFVLVTSMSSLLALGACSSSDGAGGGGGGGGGGTTSPDGAVSETGGPADPDGATGLDGSAKDGTTPDGGPGVDGATVDAEAPAVQFVGRFDETDPVGFRMAWPGSTVVARFDGTGVTVRLSQTDNGYSAGPSWFNLIIDDDVKAPFSVAAFSEDHVLAAGLAPGPHKVEIEKRTEANHGVVRFEGFTFSGGTGLLAPPARRPHRLELISESTIDGFGVEGNNTTTCIGTAPPQFDNVRKSVAMYTGAGVAAEVHVTAYSGKGISKNGSPGDTLTMPILFDRALPDPGNGTPWVHAKWVPDAIVISLGGVDYGDGVALAPADFQTKYAAFVAQLRAAYGNAPYIVLTVWSQIKNNGGNDELRTPVTAALDGVVATRAGLGDTKVSRFSFPEADPAVETGCYSHANDAHHQAMAALLVAELKAKIPGW